MKLSDFKNVTTKPCEIEFDEKYLDSISKLPEERPKRHTLEIISTVAAAVVIIAAVSIWAIIGRGVRGNVPEVEAEIPSDNDTATVVEGSFTEIPVTNDLNAKFNMDLFGKYDVFCFREFDQKNPLSVHEILQINRYASNGIKINENYMTGKMINDYAQKLFGIRPADEFALYGCLVELGDVDYAGYKVEKVTSEQLSDGTKKYRIEANDFTEKRILEYIGTDLFEPIQFTAFYKGDTELSKDYADVAVYKTLCDELDADKNVESYILYLPTPPEKTEVGYSAKVILPDYAFTDGKPHAILGRTEKFKPHQTAELSLQFKKTENGLELIKETVSDSVVVQKIDTQSLSADEYEITGEDALKITALFERETKEEDCVCTPTHTLTVGGKTYKIAIGDYCCSHFAIDNRKYTFTVKEYKQLTAIFDRCIVKDNFIQNVKLDADKNAVESINVIVYDLTEERTVKKEFTITDEDAKKLSGLIKSKTFGCGQPKTFFPDVVLEISGYKYRFKITGEKLYVVSDECGLCALDPTDEIIEMIEFYINFEDGYNERYSGVYKSYDGGKTYKKYIARQKAIDLAIEKSKTVHKEAGEMYYDFTFNKATLGCGCKDGKWASECVNSSAENCRVCWAVYLLSRKGENKYAVYYVDAVTGEVNATAISTFHRVEKID